MVHQKHYGMRNWELFQGIWRCSIGIGKHGDGHFGNERLKTLHAHFLYFGHAAWSGKECKSTVGSHWMDRVYACAMVQSYEHLEPQYRSISYRIRTD